MMNVLCDAIPFLNTNFKLIAVAVVVCSGKYFSFLGVLC
jgi:hypothetical protein